MCPTKVAIKLARQTAQGAVEALPVEPRLVNGVQEEIAFGSAAFPGGKRCRLGGTKGSIKPVIGKVLDGHKESRLTLGSEAPLLVTEFFSFAAGCLSEEDNASSLQELGPAKPAGHPAAPVSSGKEEGFFLLADRGEIAVQIDKIHSGVQLSRARREAPGFVG
jgi:hypothetical protein